MGRYSTLIRKYDCQNVDSNRLKLCHLYIENKLISAYIR